MTAAPTPLARSVAAENPATNLAPSRNRMLIAFPLFVLRHFFQRFPITLVVRVWESWLLLRTTK
jgi:hypothetical protein